MANNPATNLVVKGEGMLSPGLKAGLAIVSVFVLYLIATKRLGIYLGLFTG